MSTVHHSEPKLAEPVAPDSYTQPIGEILADPLSGISYWEQEGINILKEAYSQAQDLQEAGKILPAWATAVLHGYSHMRKAGELASVQLASDTQILLEGHQFSNKGNYASSVMNWYQRIGTTNESPDLVPVYSTIIDKLESKPQSVRRDLLIGNLLEDMSLQSSDLNNRTDLLKMAARAYGRIEDDMQASDHERHLAIQHGIDCQHQLISIQYQNGEISVEEFYKKFEHLQAISINRLLEANDPAHDGNISGGDLLEWASLIFLRHKYWSDETAEDYDVRAALIREDQGIYPWRATNSALPIWSFDTVVAKSDGTGQPLRIQLKGAGASDALDRYHVYLPNQVKVVRSEIEGAKLRHMIKNALVAIKLTYASMHEFNADRRLDIEQKIDEKSLASVEQLYESLVVPE